MKLVITQMNVGGRLRFIPGGANGTSLHNYPRDGWLTETAARKWAKQNGHEIVKVEKMAGKGEKTFRIEYTYKDRNGRTKTSSPEFVGTSVEPLKKRIVEGLERNGDKLISFGKITSKDSVDRVDAVEEIREKYSNDVYSPILGKEFSGKGKDFDKALKEKRYEGLYKQIDFYLKHYSKQHKLSDVQMKDLKRLVNEIRSYGKGGERWVNEVKKTVKEFKDSVDSADSVDFIRQKYAKDAAFGVKVKGNEKGSERLTMEKVFKELSPAPAWKKVKKGNTIVIRTNINGKDQDVVTIKYFNPNVVAMTPKGGAANMVALKDVTVMCSKLGVEGRRSYNDSADGVERIRAKYSTDAYNLGMETKEFDPKAQLKVLSVTTKKEPDGISGRVIFTKGKKKTSERFMVYKSGNWDVTPGGGFGITGLTAGDKQALMNAVRNKLSTMGIKAK